MSRLLLAFILFGAILFNCSREIQDIDSLEVPVQEAGNCHRCWTACGFGVMAMGATSALSIAFCQHVNPEFPPCSLLVPPLYPCSSPMVLHPNATIDDFARYKVDVNTLPPGLEACDGIVDRQIRWAVEWAGKNKTREQEIMEIATGDQKCPEDCGRPDVVECPMFIAECLGQLVDDMPLIYKAEMRTLGRWLGFARDIAVFLSGKEKQLKKDSKAWLREDICIVQENVGSPGPSRPDYCEHPGYCSLRCVPPACSRVALSLLSL